MRKGLSIRINLAPERAAERFPHSQDPQRTWSQSSCHLDGAGDDARDLSDHLLRYLDRAES
jgi:hypothetical protein